MTQSTRYLIPTLIGTYRSSMKTTSLALALVPFALAGCLADREDVFSEEEMATIRTMGPLPATPPSLLSAATACMTAACPDAPLPRGAHPQAIAIGRP